ncbi:MAG: hypothetical protein IJI22_02190 [Bacilli bacterium]|nr:hypothetical protein [Bacilli bacterium]
MSKNIIKKIVLFSLITAYFFSACFHPTKVNAEDKTFEISTTAELAYASTLSQQEGNQDYTFILTADITITEEEQEILEQTNYPGIVFGSSDYPFAGVFDGRGHTINNLKYNTVYGMDHDNGLFSYTNGATIKNLTINNAEIRSYFRGGVLVGYAENTIIDNVTVKNSHLFVTAADNVVTLVTDGGVRGGALAGDAINSTIYNCESNDNFVNTNSTSGVAALGGKGLALGGLVGISRNTEIEYSRVIKGKVSNYYDVAVGAVGGNTLYVGGIIGRMQEASKVIDSFSTAELYFYCATYVSVGAGNTGHIGGIAATVDGNQNEIYRSHYAGIATSRQYNAVVLLPIIQNNVNISGIADIYDGGAVVGAYFKSELNPDVNMGTLGSNSSTTAYGPVTNANYTNKNYWQEQSYDFLGTANRTSRYSAKHNNKWVMDYSEGIPVHGKSMSATLDYPGAGEVSIAKTDLVNSPVSTTNPYEFAVQGMRIHEDETTITATTNNGYRFLGWYKVPKVAAWSLEEDHEYFENIFATIPRESTNNEYTINFNDNDLYVAYYQAQVTFHDYLGGLIDTAGNAALTTNDYYDYAVELPEVIPVNKPASANAKLIGWTTTPSTTGGGYPSISSTDLANLKSNNDFYEAGDEITKTLDLYPIYVDLVSNINLVFEGNELDSSNNAYERTGVGSATVTVNNDNTVTLSVVGANNGSLPDGYRFLGWYDSNDMRISKDMSYIINTNDLDLTTQHTYTAKFEYRVRYYVRAYTQGNGNNFTNSELYKTMWVEYNSDFQNIAAPGYIREFITHWGTSHINHGATDDTSDTYTGKITAPFDAYSHNYNITNGNDTLYKVQVDMDFPGSGQIRDNGSSGGVFNHNTANFEFIPVSNKYHLLFWTLERTDDNSKHWTYASNPYGTGDLTTPTDNIYLSKAFVTADVNFYNKDNTYTTVQRRYNTNVFNTEEVYTYKYPHYNTIDVPIRTYDNIDIINPVTFEASPTDSSMTQAGYYFLGWISSLDVEPNSAEWNYIYDVAGDNYTTSNMQKARPYLVDQNMLVEETVDLYPVYAKYNIETTTNVISINNNVNVPPNPIYSLQENADGTGVVTITPDTNTYVVNGEDAKYTLYSVTLKINNSEEIELVPENGIYTYAIEAGPTYTFTANYEPYIVIYHLDDSNITTYIKNSGDELGEIPTPTYDINSLGAMYQFVGYTKTVPSTGMSHLFASKTDFENSNLTLAKEEQLITDSIELYPVYVSATITLNSNIDDYLTNNQIDKSTVYNITRPIATRMNATVLTSKVNHYHFIGWYESYQDMNNLGTLISKNENYELSDTEKYSNKTYTAVYKESYEVIYYNINGSILKTVYIPVDQTRTFQTTTQDESGNNIETPIDYEAFVNIYNTLAPNEILINYNWLKDDGTLVSWNDFKNNPISSDMKLYPVTNRIIAYDSNNVELDSTVTKEIIVATKNDKVLVTLNTTYKQPELRIHVDTMTYTPDNIAIRDLPNVNVEFYKNEVIEDPLTKQTDSRGNALFKFYVDVEVTKNTMSDQSQTDIFVFEITNKTTNENTNILLKPGETETVRLPFGDYTISEDSAWAWRYQDVSFDFSLDNYSIGPNLTISNTKLKSNWLDSMNYNSNTYD